MYIMKPAVFRCLLICAQSSRTPARTDILQMHCVAWRHALPPTLPCTSVFSCVCECVCASLLSVVSFFAHALTCGIIFSRREEEDAQEEAQKFAAQPSNSLGPAPRSPNKTAAVVSPFLREFMASQHQELVLGGSVNTSSFLSNNPFLKPFGGAGEAGVAGSGLLWGQQETSSSGLFRSLAANSSSGLFRSLAANSFFPSAGVSNPFLPVAGNQEEDKERNDDEESAGDVEREVISCPSSLTQAPPPLSFPLPPPLPLCPTLSGFPLTCTCFLSPSDCIWSRGVLGVGSCLFL